jgi:hypothetical protein
MTKWDGSALLRREGASQIALDSLSLWLDNRACERRSRCQLKTWSLVIGAVPPWSNPGRKRGQRKRAVIDWI